MKAVCLAAMTRPRHQRSPVEQRCVLFLPSELERHTRALHPQPSFFQRTNAVTEVKIYSNAKRVELFVNGKSQGGAKPNVLHIARWPKVNLASGKNSIKVIAYADGRLIEDHCEWNLIQN